MREQSGDRPRKRGVHAEATDQDEQRGSNDPPRLSARRAGVDPGPAAEHLAEGRVHPRGRELLAQLQAHARALRLDSPGELDVLGNLILYERVPTRGIIGRSTDEE